MTVHLRLCTAKQRTNAVRFVFVLCGALFLLFLFPRLANAAALPVENGDFGTGATAADIAAWEESGVETEAKNPTSGDESASPDGGRFAKIGRDEADEDGWICQQIDATGFGELTLSYYWRGDIQATANDAGIVEVAAGSCDAAAETWTAIAEHTLAGSLNEATEDPDDKMTSWSEESQPLPDEVFGTSFALRFRGSVSADSKIFRVDGIALDGEELPAELPKATLVIKKVVINDNGGAAAPSAFSFSALGGEPIAFPDDGQYQMEIEAGAFTVVEAGLPIEGYDTSYEGCSAEAAPGEVVVCTITNDDQETTVEPQDSLPETEACDDGIDNDGDGATDAEDTDCNTTEEGEGEAEIGEEDDSEEAEDENEESGGRNRGSRSIGSIARQGAGAVLGVSVSNTSLPPASECVDGQYLTAYLKEGAANSPEEVKKLQQFLGEHLGTALTVDGIFGPATFRAVQQFQLLYKKEILTPWVGITLKNDTRGTGWVYKTTKRWIDMLKCGSTLPMPALT